MSIRIPFETTLEVRDTCLVLHVQRAARVLARRFDEAFRPLHLSSRQFSLLMSLNRPEPPSVGAVARLLAMDRTTLTAALKPLERDGLVAVRPDPADRRSRLLSLTDEGREVLAAAVGAGDELRVLRRYDGMMDQALLEESDLSFAEAQEPRAGRS